jgi:hypothetical protein
MLIDHVSIFFGEMSVQDLYLFGREVGETGSHCVSQAGLKLVILSLSSGEITDVSHHT